MGDPAHLSHDQWEALMNLYGLVKVLHILAVTAVIAGVVGRALIRARLLRLDDIHIVSEFMQLEGHFDEWLVVRGSIATRLPGLLLTWLGHWPLVNAGVPTWTLVGAVLFLATIPLVIEGVFIAMLAQRFFGK
jgi:uncharacterized membrane protein